MYHLTTQSAKQSYLFDSLRNPPFKDIEEQTELRKEYKQRMVTGLVGRLATLRIVEVEIFMMHNYDYCAMSA